MFRFFVAQGATPMKAISELHPAIIEALLERCWNSQVKVPGLNLGHPDHRSDVAGRPNQLLDLILTGVSAGVTALDSRIKAFKRDPADPADPSGISWQHLIYAYMIENTRAPEVFRRVLDAFFHGERLGSLSAQSQRWLWTTEELFFRNPPSFSIGTLNSDIRSNPAPMRANAHHRLFGMTLNAMDGNKPAFTVAEHANADFVQVFDELLHEIWQGRTNFANAIGARPTDDAKIAALATRLCEMLRARRTQGTLSREEFSAVCMMEWFHATLATPDHPIIVDLRAEAPSPEERLFKIAQRVGYSAHGLAKSYFEIAEPLSRLLIAIEAEDYNRAVDVPALYTPAPPAPPGGPGADTDLIVNHWSTIRGRDVKAKKLVAA